MSGRLCEKCGQTKSDEISLFRFPKLEEYKAAKKYRYIRINKFEHTSDCFVNTGESRKFSVKLLMKGGGGGALKKLIGSHLLSSKI